MRYFKNGRDAALKLGCSHPLVYYALDGKIATACGWHLRWIKEEDASLEWKAEQLERKMEREEARKEARKRRNARIRAQYAKDKAARGEEYHPWSKYRTEGN